MLLVRLSTEEWAVSLVTRQQCHSALWPAVEQNISLYMEIKNNVCCLLILNVFYDFEPPNFIPHIQVLLPEYNVTN